jgi:DNA-binding MarR family transcriptional regulator
MNNTPLDLREFLPYRLSVLTNKVSRALAGLYSSRFGLSVTEWRVMAVLGQQPGLSADAVCARTEMDKVGVSRAVARLLEKGWLARDFAPTDRRRSVLRLTPRGRSVYRRITPLARAFHARLISALDEREQKQLMQLLDRLDAQAAGLAEPE